MEKEQIQKALDIIKKQPSRKFKQSYDLIINLKDINIKQTPLDFFANLAHSNGKQIKVAAIVDQELFEPAGKFCDLTIKEIDFPKYSDKKILKKLAEEYDYFIAQANLMPKLAVIFGKVLGIRGKMPNPKLGCVVPPNANMETLVKKLRLSVRLQAKKATNFQCLIGKESQKDEEIVENVLAVYQGAVKQLPKEVQNIKNVYLKLTMGKPVRL